MVETALTLPIALLLLFVAIDLARAAYTWVIIGQDAQTAARLASLPDNQSSDCREFATLGSGNNGVTVAADDKSVFGDTATNHTAAPSLPANTGALYLYPAEAKTAPVATNCSNAIARVSGPVAATVTFNFQPWTPIASQLVPSIAISATATEDTQY